MIHEFDVRLGDKIRIGEQIIASVERVGREKVKIGIEAQPDILIRRGELPRYGGILGVRVPLRGR